jgi:hypothetical protein
MAEKKKRFTLDLDPEMQRRLKVIAALKGVSMRQYCLAAIEKELTRDTEVEAGAETFGQETLDRLTSLQAEIFRGRKVPGDSTELIRESRETRDRNR